LSKAPIKPCIAQSDCLFVAVYVTEKRCMLDVCNIYYPNIDLVIN